MVSGNGSAGTETATCTGDVTGAIGAGGGGAGSNISTSLGGGNGGSYGAGGGGAYNGTTGTGTGANGLIILEWTPVSTNSSLTLLGAGP